MFILFVDFTKNNSISELFTGLILNTLGGALYSYVKYREGERKKQKIDLDSTKHQSIADLVSQSEKEPLNSKTIDQNGYRRNFNQESINYENEHTKSLV